MTQKQSNLPGLDRLTEVETAQSVAYQSEPIEIEGVISQTGQAGVRGKHRDKDYDVQGFGFVAWRRPGQPIVEEKLYVMRAVPLEAPFDSDFSSLSIHRFWVLLSVDETRAIIWKQSETAPDTNQLVTIAEELAKPVVISTEKFGDMNLNPQVNCMKGKVTWNGKPIELSIDLTETDGFEKGLKTAEALYEDQALWSKKVEDYAAEKILPRYNDGWRLLEDPVMTPEEFISKISLSSISIDDSDRFTFWHSDGDIFGGHYVEVAGNLKTGLDHADTPG